MPDNKKGWETRRAKYGQRGHKGYYSCGNRAELHQKIKRMEDALIKLHIEGVLSEGQACRITGIYRIELRERADDMLSKNKPLDFS